MSYFKNLLSTIKISSLLKTIKHLFLSDTISYTCIIKTNYYKRKNLKCFLCVLCFRVEDPPSCWADDPCGKNHLSCFSICSLRSLGTLRLNSLLLFVFILFVAIGYSVSSVVKFSVVKFSVVKFSVVLFSSIKPSPHIPDPHHQCS